MKQLTCEMCGSTDLVKQDGVFVCQSCGTKYSIEEAKKMMVEGTVEVTGTVQVDDSAKIDNYYTMALSAYKARNLAETESYCNKIIEIVPKHYKAWLLKGQAAGEQSTLQELRLEEAAVCFTNAIQNAPHEDHIEWQRVVDDSYDSYNDLRHAAITLKLDNLKAAPSKAMVDEFLKLKISTLKNWFILHNALVKCNSDIMASDVRTGTILKEPLYDLLQDKEYEFSTALTIWKQAVADYEKHAHPDKDALNHIDVASDIVYKLLKGHVFQKIDPMDHDDEKNFIIKAAKQAIIVHTYQKATKCYTVSFEGGYKEYEVDQTRTPEAQKWHDDEITKLHRRIKELDPTYEIPTPPIPPKESKQGGCYVATAVYGAYDCPEVWTLRRFRDYILAETWYGRAFIRVYYAISHTLMKWFGETKWFKKIWKCPLDRMVAKLQSKGVENTPYQDRKW